MSPMELNRFCFTQDMLDEMLRPGYSALETGYRPLPDGDMYAATYTRFPLAKGKMIKWWFTTGLYNTQSYKFWHPDHTTFRWNEKKRPDTVVGATHISEELLGGEVVPMEITFFDPADIFDVSKFDEANISCALVAEIRKPDGELFAMFLHIVRDTVFGCEMRNRFWMVNADEAGAAALIQHNLEEMGNLAEFLPGYYLRETNEK